MPPLPDAGEWDATSAVPLNWTEGDVWTAEAEVPVGCAARARARGARRHPPHAGGPNRPLRPLYRGASSQPASKRSQSSL
jgi:hypothetical protein